MATQDFSDLLAAEPGAKPSAAAPAAIAQPKPPAATQGFDDLLAAEPGARPAGGGASNVDAFVRQYTPLAQRVARQVGVAPEMLLGQWGLETGWGKSVIPGTNNLGNIKDFSGRGVQATDNMTGSRDGYRAYDNAEAFGDDFAGLLARRYKSAIGAGSDPQRYFSALKMGGYAEDPDYVSKGVNAARMAAQALGSGGQQESQVGRDPYTDTMAKPEPKRSFFGAVNDTVIDTANAAAGLVKAGIDLFGPDSAASKFIDENIIKAGQNSQSDYKKFLRNKLQAELADAGINDGSTAGEVAAEFRKAGVQLNHAITQDPLGTFGEIFGNIGPFAILGRGMEAAKLANGVKSAISATVAGGMSAGEVRGNIWEKISGMSDAELQKASPAYAELRKTMPEDAAKREIGANLQRNLPEVALAGLVGALSGKFGPEAMVAGVAPKYATGRIGSAALGFMDEGPLQGGAEQVASNYGVQKAIPSQSLIEGVGPNIVAEGIPGVAMGAAYGGGNRNAHVPPALQPVAEKAAEPNSPLSKAALAGANAEIATGANKQPGQAVDQAKRLAELEAIAKGTPSQQVTDDAGNPLTIPGEPGRFFTAEEKAEYDQLVSLKKATEEVAGSDKVDEISARVDEISQSIRDNKTLQSMRDAGENTSSLLKDLAIAKSKSTPAAQREQALARVELTLGLDDRHAAQQAKPARQPGNAIESALTDERISPQDREDLSINYAASRNPQLPAGTRQRALERAQEIVGRYAAPESSPAPDAGAPAVLQDIEPQPGTPEEADRLAERYESGAFEMESVGYPDEAAALQAQADSAREEAAVRREMQRAATAVESVQAPDVATPAGPGPAVRRKRRATIDQLVQNGLNRVERRDDGLYLLSQNGRQEFKLDGMADAQLARAAIADSIRRGAAEANPNPTDGQKRAGNYKTGTIKFDGIELAIETRQGGTRSGTDADGNRWEVTMPANYGYIRGSAMAADGDKVDIYLPDNARSGSPAWIIDQYNDDGSFDETKTVLGVRTAEEAARIYDAGFSDGSGPRRRGAITEMPVDEFKAWAMSDAAKKPAGAPRAKPADIIQAAQRDGVSIDGTMSVNVDGKSVEIGLVKELSKSESAARGGRASRTSAAQGRVLRAIAAAFGKDIQFFYEKGNDVGDGFIIQNDPKTIYLNESSGRSPIVVFGHELLHQLKRDNPEAHAALSAVVARRMKTKKVKETYGKLGYQNGQMLEELVSDLGGDLMSDPSFWAEVFEEVRANNDASAAQKIIAQLAEFVMRAVNALSKNLRSYADTGAGSELVNDMQAIRDAFRGALAGYIQQQGITQQAMQADVLRAGQEAKRSAARRAEETDNFKRWFGDSKVVDANGNPLVVYHGTSADFTEFDTDSFFTPDAKAAKKYGKKVVAVYLSLKNPKVIDYEGREDNDIVFDIEQAKEDGHDGLIVLDTYDGYVAGDQYIAFHPEQIKSATGNNGDYSLTNPNITRSAQRDMFQEDMIGPDATVETSRPASSKGDTELGVNVNSTGRQIAPTRQALENFWKWFGNSQTVDDEGRPSLYYHTTLNDFEQFEANRVTANSGTFGDWETSRAAIFFTESLDDSQAYGRSGDGFAAGANVMPVYIRAENILDMSGGYLPSFGRDAFAIEEAGLNPRYMEQFDWSKFDDEDGRHMVDALKRAGYDGIKFWDENPHTRESFLALAVFDPGQIKSALGNRGTFDGSSGSVARSADREDALTVEAYHFSKQPRNVLTTAAYGTGLQGSDRDAIMAHPDKRLRNRLYFYVNKGTGVRPESGVGGIAHKATLSNVYDADADLKRLKEGRDKRAFESAVLDAGYSGYLSRLEGTQPGQVILLGRQNVQPEILGPRTQIPEAKLVPQPAARELNIGDRIAANKSLPSGAVSPQRWGEYIERLMPAEYAELADSGVFDGDKAIYKDELVSRVRKLDSIVASKARGQDPAIGDKTDVDKLPQGREIPPEVGVGGLQSSLELARSKSYRRGRDLKKDIQDRVLAAAKKARVNLSARNKSTHRFLSDMVVDDARFALQSNENAVGWYDTKVSRAIGALSTIHPEINTDTRSRLAFLWALATTSNGLKVNKNFELAEQAYRTWKETGRMPEDIGIGNAAQAINKGMAQYNELSAKVGDERLLKFMSTKFAVREIENMLGVSVGGEWMSTPVRGAAILGPKIGNGFFSNLNGYFDALTMDRWLMRTWGRMTGTLLEVSNADIAKSRDKLSGAIANLSPAERKTIGELIGKSIKKNLARAEVDAIATASQKASMKVDKREVMMSTDAMNAFRKAANLHHMTMDGQKEAPAGPGERNWIRAVFQDALDRLRADDTDMTMSDLQALLWYPERRLYDAAKSEEDVSNGYEDDEAPDYANAAYDLAIKSGVSEVRVLAAMDAAEARGTVQGAQMSSAEKQAMLNEFRAAPEQGVQLAFEVAPDPDSKALTAQWETLPFADKTEITKLVKDAVLKDVVEAVGAEVTKTVPAIGGYAGLVNPNLITEYKRTKVSIEQARALAAGIGSALDQDSVAVVDPRASETVGIVRITLSKDAGKLAGKVFDAIRAQIPEVDAFTARGRNFDILNFTAIPTEELAGRIENALASIDDDVEAAVSFGESRSELIEKADYEDHIQRARPGSGQEVRERIRGARDRARAIVAAELGRRNIEVPGRAGAARPGDAGSGQQVAGGAAAQPVPDANGVRRSAGRLEVEGGSDSRPEGRQEDGSLIGLPRDFTVAGQPIRASHWAPAEAVARQYMADAGLEYTPPSRYAKVDPARAKRIAAEYDKLQHDPQNPEVKAAYEALARETIAQYKAVIDSGLQVEFIDFAKHGDPYAASPRLMTEDVRNNNHMWVFSTRDGFGSDVEFDPIDNPLLAETEFEISGQKALVNDLFRCFVAGTLVRTRNGFVPIDLIKEGDEVLTHKGRYRRVVATMQRQHDGEVVDVLTNASHTPITATSDHAFYVLQGNHDRRKKTPCTPYICGRKSSITGKFTSQDKLHEFVWKEVGSLPEGTWFPMVTDKEVVDLEYVSVPEQFISERSRGPAAFALTPEFLWLVGLYIAEGSAGDNVISFALNANEMRFAERIEKFVRGSGYGRSESGGISISANGENGMYIKINSSTLSKWFPAWLGSGAANKAIPQELMRLPADKLKHLARGIMDGDGRKRCGSIEQTSLQLALQLMEVGARLGFQPTARAAHHDGDSNHSVVYGVHEVIEAKHEDRQKRYTWRILGEDCRQIKSISRRHFSGVVYDIEVEEDHSFVVQNVPVHNCVHDYFGHVKEGVGFRADGEENTWRAHSAMFSPLAQRALTTETRGQNSWVNYGPHGDANRKASAGETHYADQKVGLLPEWVSEDGRRDPSTDEYNRRIRSLEELLNCFGK